MTQFRQQRAAMLSGALLLVLSLALLPALSGPQPVAAEDDYLLIEARIAAQRHVDGLVEVLLEVQRDSAGWSSRSSLYTALIRIPPDRRVVELNSPRDGARSAGQFGITARRIEGGHVELGLQRVTGVHWGERLLPRFGRLDSPRYGMIASTRRRSIWSMRAPRSAPWARSSTRATVVACPTRVMSSSSSSTAARIIRTSRGGSRASISSSRPSTALNTIDP